MLKEKEIQILIRDSMLLQLVLNKNINKDKVQINLILRNNLIIDKDVSINNNLFVVEKSYLHIIGDNSEGIILDRKGNEGKSIIFQHNINIQQF